MGTKKTGSTKRSRPPASPKRPAAARQVKVPPATASAARRTSRHIDALFARSRGERSAFFETSSSEKLLDVFETSYPSDLVNILLDLKKNMVKHLFETLAAIRKRSIAETATLYYYKEYLTNPLPLRVETETGISIPNFYAILGVPREATDEDLKTAHRLLAKAHSHDAFAPAVREAGDERLREINEAYTNLKNPQKRATADRLLPNVSYLYPRRDQSWLEAVHRILG